MSTLFDIDFDNSCAVNHLWPTLVESLGFQRAQRAVQQARDLQCMSGNENTLAVLFFETCGIALLNINSVRLMTGLECNSLNTVLIFSIKDNFFQLITQF